MPRDASRAAPESAGHRVAVPQPRRYARVHIRKRDKVQKVTRKGYKTDALDSKRRSVNRASRHYFYTHYQHYVPIRPKHNEYKSAASAHIPDEVLLNKKKKSKFTREFCRFFFFFKFLLRLVL